MSFRGLKKLAIVVLLAELVVSLFGCKSLPKDMSQEFYDEGVQAVRIVENYMSGKHTIFETGRLLEEVWNDTEKLTTDGYRDVIVRSYIFSLYQAFSLHELVPKLFDNFETNFASLKDILEL